MAIKNCEFCGSVYSDNDDGCPNCRKNAIVVAHKDLTEDFEGYPKSKWHRYIDFNSDRYMRVFEKHEGKKWFISLNWSALLFNFMWMLYRRLYKMAFFYLIFLNIFSVIYFFGVTAAFSGAEANYEAAHREWYAFRQTDEYEIYVTKQKSPPMVYDEDGWLVEEEIADDNEYVIKYEELEENMNDARALSSCYLPVLYIGIFAIDIIIRLFSDCVYKQHIKKNIENPPKGTSVALGIWGYFIRQAITALIVGGTILLVAWIFGMDTLYSLEGMLLS